MEDLQYQSKAAAPSTRSEANMKREMRREKKRSFNWVNVLIPTILWLFLAGGSYYLATNTVQSFNQQLEQIQQSNTAKVEELTQSMLELQTQLSEVTATLTGMEAGLELVQEELALAGDTFSSTDETKQALSQQMTSLNKELEGLRKSIQKLEEAARVY